MLPVGLDSFGWKLRNPRPCCVVYGKPFELTGLPKGGRGYREGTELIRERIVALWRQAVEATTAGFPEQLPDGARRHRAANPGRPWLAHLPCFSEYPRYI